MKNKMLSALLLSALMIKTPVTLAMEEPLDGPPQKKPRLEDPAARDSETVNAYLHLAALQEKDNELRRAAENYGFAAELVLEDEKKIELTLKEAFLYEKLDDEEGMREAYWLLAEVFPDPAKKSVYFLKNAALSKRPGFEKEQALLHQQAAYYSDNKGVAFEQVLLSKNLFKKINCPRGVARAYKIMANLFEDRENSLTYALKAASLYEKEGMPINAANLSCLAALLTQDKTQKEALFSSALSVYEKSVWDRGIAKTYLFKAIQAQDHAQKVELAQSAFSFFQKLEPGFERRSPKGLFFSSFFLSLWENNPLEKKEWLKKAHTFWQDVPKTLEDRRKLDKTVRTFRKIEEKDLADVLENFITQQWPKE